MPTQWTIGTILLALLRWSPRIIAVVYGIILITASASVALREGKPEIFLVDGLGAVVSGADNELSKNMVEMESRVASNSAGILDMLNVLGPLLLIYYVLKIIKYGLDQSFQKEMVSPIMLWFWAFVILFLVQTLFYSVTQGELIMGFSGVLTFITHLDVFFAPIYGPVTALGKASASSPFF